METASFNMHAIKYSTNDDDDEDEEIFDEDEERRIEEKQRRRSAQIDKIEKHVTPKVPTSPKHAASFPSAASAASVSNVNKSKTMTSSRGKNDDSSSGSDSDSSDSSGSDSDSSSSSSGSSSSDSDSSDDDSDDENNATPKTPKVATTSSVSVPVSISNTSVDMSSHSVTAEPARMLEDPVPMQVDERPVSTVPALVSTSSASASTSAFTPTSDPADPEASEGPHGRIKPPELIVTVWGTEMTEEPAWTSRITDIFVKFTEQSLYLHQSADKNNGFSSTDNIFGWYNTTSHSEDVNAELLKLLAQPVYTGNSGFGLGVPMSDLDSYPGLCEVLVEEYISRIYASLSALRTSKCRLRREAFKIMYTSKAMIVSDMDETEAATNSKPISCFISNAVCNTPDERSRFKKVTFIPYMRRLVLLAFYRGIRSNTHPTDSKLPDLPVKFKLEDFANPELAGIFNKMKSFTPVVKYVHESFIPWVRAEMVFFAAPVMIRQFMVEEFAKTNTPFPTTLEGAIAHRPLVIKAVGIIRDALEILTQHIGTPYHIITKLRRHYVPCNEGERDVTKNEFEVVA